MSKLQKLQCDCCGGRIDGMSVKEMEDFKNESY